MINSIKIMWRFFRQEILKTAADIQGQKLLLKEEKYLIIAPHPDDEVLGCGGLLAICNAIGCKIDILFLTNGEASHQGCCTLTTSEIGIKRKLLAIAANKILGISENCLHFFDGINEKLPQINIAGFREYADGLASYIHKLNPTIIFCPHPFEGWADHIAAQELTYAALQTLPPSKKPILYYYCVWFWYSMPLKKAVHIDWQKARILNINEHHSLKQQAIRTYSDALAPCGKPWIGKLPDQFLRAFNWDKELFFEADVKD